MKPTVVEGWTARGKGGEYVTLQFRMVALTKVLGDTLDSDG